jgi:xylulokinase
MDRELILTIDLGTTGCRAILFNTVGQIVASAYEEYGIIHPRPDWAEQDPYTWWSAVRNTVCRLSERGRAVAVSVTSQREGIVPVDGNGQALSNCIIWMDKRTIPQCDRISERIDTSVLFRTTGLRLDPAFSLAKLLWIREQQPSVYAAAHKFLQAEDYLLAQLSGEFVTEHSIASRTMLLDVHQRRWSEDILNRFEIDMAQLPQLLEPGTAIGSLRREVGRELGLPREVLVVAGGGDQQCNAVGAGAVQRGSASIGLGTATAPSVTIHMPVIDPEMRVPCCCAAVPGKWEFEPPIWTTGALLRWFRDQFGHEEIRVARERGVDPYEILTAEAATVPPGSDGLITLPYFMVAGAPNWNALARGVLFGLSLGHTRAHVIRSLMEAVAYEVLVNVEAIAQLGWPLDTLHITGGGSRSALWQEILCDVTGRRVALASTEDTPSLGAAVLASVGVGFYSSVDEAVIAMTRAKGEQEPNAARHALYRDYYVVYREAYRGLVPAYQLLNEIERKGGQTAAGP